MSKLVVDLSLANFLDKVDFSLRDFSSFIEGSQPECEAVVELVTLGFIVEFDLLGSHSAEQELASLLRVSLDVLGTVGLKLISKGLDVILSQKDINRWARFLLVFENLI